MLNIKLNEDELSDTAVTRREMISATALSAAISMPLLAAQGTQSQPPPRQSVNREELLKQALPNVSGKEVTVITIDYAPGATSAKHKHPNTSIVAYVLQGSVTSGLNDQKPVTYREGQYWWEPPGTVHSVSRNASKTRRAKLLVFLVGNQGEPSTIPA